jgi:hypothetical protein
MKKARTTTPAMISSPNMRSPPSAGASLKLPDGSPRGWWSPQFHGERFSQTCPGAGQHDVTLTIHEHLESPLPRSARGRRVFLSRGGDVAVEHR